MGNSGKVGSEACMISLESEANDREREIKTKAEKHSDHFICPYLKQVTTDNEFGYCYSRRRRTIRGSNDRENLHCLTIMATA